jgi:hypothetical protein
MKGQRNCVVHVVSSHLLASNFLCEILQGEPGIKVDDSRSLPPGVSSDPCVFLVDTTILKQPPETVVRALTARFPAAKFILLTNDAENYETDMFLLLFTGIHGLVRAAEVESSLAATVLRGQRERLFPKRVARPAGAIEERPFRGRLGKDSLDAQGADGPCLDATRLRKPGYCRHAGHRREHREILCLDHPFETGSHQPQGTFGDFDSLPQGRLWSHRLMFVDIFILAFCTAAVVYWMRHSVLTILGSRSAEDALRLAEANRLEFLLVRRVLESSSALTTQGSMAESLGYDFLALTYLLRSSPRKRIGRYSRQEWLLVIDFRLMRAFHAAGQLLSPRLTQYALLEMTKVLEYLAGAANRRLSSLSLDVLA